jgi:hypothetical protein
MKNDKVIWSLLEMSRAEQPRVYLNLVPHHLPGGTEENSENTLVIIVSLTARIWTWDFQRKQQATILSSLPRMMILKHGH